VFSPDGLWDRIRDFTNGQDQIDLAAFNLVSIADLRFRDGPQGLEIIMAKGEGIRLINVHSSQFDADDFIF